jgi:hypothetical protein
MQSAARLRLAPLLAACLVAAPGRTIEAAAAAQATAALVTGAAYAALSTPQDYISRFVLYVRWPDDAAIKAWQVCVASPATTGDDYYATLTVRERPFTVRHVTAADALGTCQILDLSGIAAAQAKDFLQPHVPGVLTVGDGKDFCSAGGLICLRLGEPQGGFEVNLSAVKNSGLAINAQLLMLARQPATDAGTRHERPAVT